LITFKFQEDKLEKAGFKTENSLFPAMEKGVFFTEETDLTANTPRSPRKAAQKSVFKVLFFRCSWRPLRLGGENVFFVHC
jgi:hypothetical protein